MFGWRKRNQGFEWRQYVRTTILVRRQQRREKLDEVRQAAVDGLKEAGRKGAAASSSGLTATRDWLAAALGRGGAGLKTGIAGLVSGLGSGIASVAAGSGRIARAAGARLGPAVGAIMQASAQASAPARRILGNPGVALALGLVAAVSALSGGSRALSQGLDRDAMSAVAVAAVAALLLMIGRAEAVTGALSAAGAWIPERLRRVPGVTVAGGLVAMLALGSGVWWLTAHGYGPAVTAGGSAQAVAPVKASGTIAGRALVRSGDTLRVAGISVRLAGIEAPDAEQTCTKGSGRRWKCGEAAQQALKSLARGKTVACEIASREDAGHATGSCRAQGVDIAAELVKGGHAFAERGLFSRYGSLEGEAMAAKAGLWSGEAERPADWRAKRWEDAKRSAPEGCPIKALVSAEGRVYVLPWSRTYDRVKVRSARGERWFCSEAEAQAAGWRPTDRS